MLVQWSLRCICQKYECTFMPTAASLLEQRWSLALETGAFGVWDLDLQTQQVHYSPEWKARLGYPATAEADPTSVWRSRVHPDDLQPMLVALQAHVEQNTRQYQREFRLRAADGRYCWVMSRGRVVETDASGRPLRLIGTLTDLTDRHEAEAMRLERDRAEARSRAQTEFLSRMSHELRTPLNAILGMTQLLSLRSNEGNEAQQRQYLGHIEQAGWQLLTMINNALDLSRIEAGKLVVTRQPVALRGLLDASLAACSAAAQQHQVTLTLEDIDPEASALGDPERLSQVLRNLLNNAIKFNRPGGSVRLGAQPCAEGWRIHVKDTGRGIAAHHLPHLFEPFNRLGQANSGVAGAGIGLVLSHWLVQAMGGQLSARSTEDEGSCFEFTLEAASAQ
ncbi:PAS domain-containing sensor histidine kinase [Ideonella sp.]|uniref:PAS domain-containing sensor histidine kinase n=1 Tax=Ideonella sp. TaxID=1929293 RepID=UPI003BB69CA5